MLKARKTRVREEREVLAALVELFNPFRTLNTHMHSKASLMVNKHHSEPSLVFFCLDIGKLLHYEPWKQNKSMPSRVNNHQGT